MLDIREAQTADAPAIVRVHVDTWRTTYQGIVPDDYLDQLSYVQREQFWLRWINAAHEKQFFYVAQAEGNIVGFAGGGPERSGNTDYSGELYAIYVLQAHQSRGIGRRLVSQVAERFLEEGMESMLVWVLAGNPSRRFYERLGGKQVAEKVITIGGAELEEVAYGWRDVCILAEMGI